jgi:hypothetical protein
MNTSSGNYRKKSMSEFMKKGDNEIDRVEDEFSVGNKEENEVGCTEYGKYLGFFGVHGRGS